jgi:hypothetical protein
MKRILPVVLLILSLGVISYAQGSNPELLIHAAQCLSAKDFLELPHSRPLNFGYLLDTKSYPGKEVIYAIEYTSHNRSRGLVFVLFLEEKDHQRVFNIQNNATFVMARGNVKFTGEALGGVWTHQHLEDAIKQIGIQPSFAIPVADIRTPSAQIRCESYADKQ